MGPERQTRRGIGTAVLIGRDIVLVSKHSLNKGLPQAVQFDATGGFYDQGQAFEVDSIISNASYIAQKLGIQHSIGGDLAPACYTLIITNTRVTFMDLSPLK